MTTLILIRHGETEANIKGVWHGSLDSALTPRGLRQVAALGKRGPALIAEYGLDGFYVSPLPRAQATAHAIAMAIGRTPIIDQGLSEFTLGDWEGRSLASLHHEENLWARWQTNPNFAPPNGESPFSFADRAQAALRRLAAQHPGGTVLIVAHGGTICHPLARWVGAGTSEWKRWEPHNCSISVIEGEGDSWRCPLFNDVRHLPADAITDGSLIGDAFTSSEAAQS